MKTYVVLIDFTEKGVQGIRESPARAAQFRDAAGKMGARVKDLYWTLGEHDGLLVLEAPDDETVTAVVLQLAGAGNVRTRTLRAFGADEMEGLLGKLN